MDPFWFFSRPDPRAQVWELLSETKSSRACLWLMLVVVTCAVIWSRWAEIDQLTRAPATVIASSKTKVVQSAEPGIVKTILVSEGDRVSEGETVLVLERTQTESAVEELEAELASSLATRARLDAEVLGRTRSGSRGRSASIRDLWRTNVTCLSNAGGPSSMRSIVFPRRLVRLTKS